MANTTFSGPLRSESTVKTISKNATTGTITEVVTFGDGPISLSDGNSNSSIQLNVPQAFDITIVGKDTTNYQIFGTVTSTTVPAFADQ